MLELLAKRGVVLDKGTFSRYENRLIKRPTPAVADAISKITGGQIGLTDIAPKAA